MNIPHQKPSSYVTNVARQDEDIPAPDYPAQDGSPAPDYAPFSSTSDPTSLPGAIGAVVPIPHKSGGHHPQPVTPEYRELAFDTEDITQEQLQDLRVRLGKILSQTLTLHESPAPRLFIILPKDASDWDPNDMYGNQFQLYFLCDCGHHTQPSSQSTTPSSIITTVLKTDGSTAKMEHRLHLAAHKGYPVRNPYGLLRMYGVQILSLLQMFRYGVEVAGYEVPSMENLAKEAEVANSPALSEGIEVALYRAIELIKRVLEHSGDTVPWPDMDRSNSDDSMSLRSQDYENDLKYFVPTVDITAPYGPYVDYSNTNGGLYRIIALDGAVRWVCYDHCVPFIRTKVSSDLQTNIILNQGLYNDRKGSLHIVLKNGANAKLVYSGLAKTQNILELSVSLEWSVSQKDLKEFAHAIEQNTSIVSISLACTKPGPKITFLNRGKRPDPILQLLGLTRLRSFTVEAMDGFLNRACIVPWFSQIRSLRLTEFMDWSDQGSKISALFRNCPKLMELSLGCKVLDLAFVTVQQALEKLDVAQQNQFQRLRLNTIEGESVRVDYSRSRVASMDLTVVMRRFPEFAISYQAIRNLTFVGVVDIAEKEHREFLEMVIRTQPHLADLRMNVSPRLFRSTYEFIRDLCLAAREKFAPIRSLILAQDLSTLTVNNILDPTSVTLSLKSYMSQASNIVMSLLEDFGYAMVEWDIHNDGMYTYPSIPIPAIHQPLKESLDGNGGDDLKLEKLHVTAYNLEPNSLHELSPLIMEKCPRLNDFQFTFRDNYRLNVMLQYAWAEWLATVSSKVTDYVLYADMMRELRLLERTCLLEFPRLRKFCITLPMPHLMEPMTFLHLWKQIEMFSVAPGTKFSSPWYSSKSTTTGDANITDLTSGMDFKSSTYLGPPNPPVPAESQFRPWAGPKMSPDLTCIRLENIHLANHDWLRLLNVIDLLALEDFSLKGSNIDMLVVHHIQGRLVPKSKSKSAAATVAVAAGGNAGSGGLSSLVKAKLKLLDLQSCRSIPSTQHSELKLWVGKHLEGCTLLI
ncbi:hypothetical protein BGZ80_001114 [Entomortierella chlamydospora]|uniref:Uncharacterized protein n=1 Tax=Entomortierella chlamydospora TaxID=101097 RepID=A0A9P6N2Y2_9FUNG|nr:hypothetical protein BGZ80_001114 [Entomortierella chlamydospora]